jgi:DNA processing protein
VIAPDDRSASPDGAAPAACDDCLRRTDLVAALAGWLDVEWRRREAPARVLALADATLLDACRDTTVRRRYEAFEPEAARAVAAVRGLVTICRCDEAYPEQLRDLPDPPAVIHVAGDAAALAADGAVAVVGARRATDYGLTVAHELGAALAATGVTVVSGLALGVDSAAHAGVVGAPRARRARAADSPSASGAAEAPDQAAEDADEPSEEPDDAGRRGAPVAVLAGGADRPYPASKRRLYQAVRASGAVVSEMPPGLGVHRWAFVARNRLIAALARVVVVVEATERSGSLTTADLGAELGRTVAAVPGRATCTLAAGTNALIRDGAVLVRGPADVLEALAELTGARYERRPPPQRLDPTLRRLLELIGEGYSTLPMLAGEGFEARVVLAALGELESLGLVRRGFGGRYERTP